MVYLHRNVAPGVTVINTDGRRRPDVATVYNQAGEGYRAYADGDLTGLFAFEGLHAYADRCVWNALDAILVDLKDAGRTSICILDAGCGPGTWLRRLVTRAHALGFTKISARGFDISSVQIEQAQQLGKPLGELPGVSIDFQVADLTRTLPEPDGAIDLTVCLYSVLSHLPVDSVPDIAAELARVTSGRFVTTVRPINSPPSVFVEPLENARNFKRDDARDVCSVELMDGRRFELTMHLFSADELTDCFGPYFDIETFRGIDLFHSRFAGDARWNAKTSRKAQRSLSSRLERLEELYSANPDFIDHAAHMLLVGRRKTTPRFANLCPRPAPPRAGRIPVNRNYDLA